MEFKKKKREINQTNPIVAPSCIIDIRINLKILRDKKRGFICFKQLRKLSCIRSPEDSTEYSFLRDFICQFSGIVNKLDQ